MRLSFLAVLFLFSNFVFGQQFTINGKVVNHAQISIDKVTIQVLNSNLSALSDEDGNFSLNINPGIYILRFSSVGYAPVNRKVVLDQSVKLDVKLEPANNRLGEAVVTAYKKETDPQKIPTSISVIDGQAVQDLYLWDIKDASAFVPNLNSASPGDNRNITSIRGISTSSYDPAVITYIDGVGQFNLDSYIPYLQNVERIEVLRGPQGTFYGRNALGGVINIITKKPTNKRNGFLELHSGNYGQQRYSVGFRSPLIQDKLYVGLSGLFNKAGGFYTNDFNNSRYDKNNTTYGNAFLKYLISNSWDFTLNYKQVANRNDGAFALVMGKEDALKDPFHLNQNALTKMIDNTKNASLSLNNYGKKVNFSSQTAYQKNHRYYDQPIDSDFSPLDAMSLVNNYGDKWNKVEVFTQEFKLSSSNHSSSPFNWTGGAYLFYQDNPTKIGMYYGDDAGLIGMPVTNITSILTNTINSKGGALFGQLGYKLSEKLHFLAGARYDYEEQKVKGSEDLQLEDSSVQVIQQEIRGKANFNAFTPSASLRYDLGEDNSFYGSYSRGFRAGGLSPVSSDPEEPAFRPFDPEYSDNFEIGSKNVFFNHRMMINLTAFYTRVFDAQVPTFVLPDAVTITKNTGEMNSKGLEVEFNGKVIPGLDIFANFGYTHARYANFNMETSNDDYSKDNTQLKGNRPVFTPDWTGALGANYSRALGAEKEQELVFGIYGKYLGDQYFDLKNNIDQKAYGLLNGNITYKNDGYSFSIWGQNLTNETYIDYAYDFGAVHFGNPMTYGVTLRKVF